PRPRGALPRRARAVARGGGRARRAAVADRLGGSRGGTDRDAQRAAGDPGPLDRGVSFGRGVPRGRAGRGGALARRIQRTRRGGDARLRDRGEGGAAAWRATVPQRRGE